MASFTVRKNELSAFDFIQNWATFPDPDRPGKMHAFVCQTDFNEWTGQAHQIYVKNYYGGDSYEEAVAGSWTDDSLWKQDKAQPAESYKSSYPDNKAEQKCVAYREISLNGRMSADFKWGNTYNISNGFSLTQWGNEYYRKDGSIFTYSVTPTDWA